MNNFVYNTPTKVYFGKGYEEKVGEIIKQLGYKKILLHYGKGSVKKIGLYDKVVKSLNDYNIDFVELGGVEPNPKITLVRKGAELCKKENVDFILALGGGSVIDSCKSIGISVYNNVDSWSLIESGTQPKGSLPIGAILTISAAGSEMSNSHVITNEEKKLKRGLNYEGFRPKFAIMNPENTYSVSPYQTACGIVDIMMHTLERYFTEDSYNLLTDSIAEAVLKTVKKAGEVVMDNPKDYESRAYLMWASSLSHNGLTGCGKKSFFPVHKMEHDVSGLFDNVSHGAGLSVLFPAWARYICKYDVERFSYLATRVFDIEGEVSAETALKGIEEMKKYFRKIGMPTTFEEIGINEEDYNNIIDKTTDNGNKELVSYIPLGKKEILEIYNLAK